MIDSVWLYSCPLVLSGKSRLESRQKALGSEDGKVVGTEIFCGSVSGQKWRSCCIWAEFVIGVGRVT